MHETDANARTWGMLCHLSALVGYLIPAGWILGPLVVWLSQRNAMPFVDDQGKESLNFQITIFIFTFFAVIFFALGFVLLAVRPSTFWVATLAISGFFGLILVVLVVYHIVYTIVGAVRASNGEYFRYPLAIRFFR